MRLLNTTTLDMREFVSDHERPRYAILSHTWGQQEISWAQWENRHASPVDATVGGQKILGCCKQALDDGFIWVWVDTCCIDKSSSAELSEAINSMFRWYRDAEVCYAYLSDVPSVTPSSQEAQDHIQKSKWFSRGWTLQELVAPKDLRFYSNDWRLLGTKTEFADMISKVTKIGTRFLFGDNLELASIAQKMSWAANRQTTRLEDQAYSLLGIFDINIPLLYGEGAKAFQRLQHTLLTTYPEDQSLFVWGNIVKGFDENPEVPDNVLHSSEPLVWQPPDAGSKVHGLLATSPTDFADSYNVVPCRTAAELFYHHPVYKSQFPSLAGNGAAKVTMVLRGGRLVAKYWSDPPIAQLKQVECCLILCNFEGLREHSGTFYINIEMVRSGQWGRLGSLFYVPGFVGHLSMFAKQTDQGHSTIRSLMLRTSPTPSAFLPGDIIIRRLASSPASGYHYRNLCESDHLGFSIFINTRLIRPGGNRGEVFAPTFVKDENRKRGFGVVVKRVESRSQPDGTSLMFSLVPCHYEPTQSPIKDRMDGVSVLWYHYPMRSPSGPVVSLCDSAHLVDDPGTGYTWRVKQKPFPRIFVRLEKYPLRAGGFVDVVEFIVGPQKPQRHHRMSGSESSDEASLRVERPRAHSRAHSRSDDASLRVERPRARSRAHSRSDEASLRVESPRARSRRGRSVDIDRREFENDRRDRRDFEIDRRDRRDIEIDRRDIDIARQNLPLRLSRSPRR